MRTRNTDSPKTPPVKKTPPARKTASASKAATAKAKQAKNTETSSTPVTTPDSKPEKSPVKASPSAVKKTTARTRTPASAKVASKRTPKSGEAQKVKVAESSRSDEVTELQESKDAVMQESVSEKLKEPAALFVEDSEKEQTTVEESSVANVIEPGKEVVQEEEYTNAKSDEKEDTNAKSDEKFTQCEPTVKEVEATTFENVQELGVPEEPLVDMEEEPLVNMEEETEVQKVVEPSENEENKKSIGSDETKKDLNEEEMKTVDDKEENKSESVNMVGVADRKDEHQDKSAQQGKDEYCGDEGLEEYGDQVDFEDPEEEEIPEDDVEESVEESQKLEEEHKELTAVANERKMKKEHEIFVGGLDPEAKEQDVRKVFAKIGEVVEVRLHQNPSDSKNKGYAFVKFSNKEHANRAMSELKNPMICGKRCATAPSEDNDTLFLGNICNTWTKEAIRQKLKDYGVEGVQTITLVPDVQHEGLSRGFAFLEFSCHAEAMLAYKRLQKPDVVFGHPERTAKVAFGEPLREPDPEIMAKVKTVFLDGLPSHWDEEFVREKLKGHGEIVRIVLARNMSTSKRKDFGFLDFSTHESAVSCINAVNTSELGDGNSKAKVKARLSNPMPKTQAVKGGMCGGFLIGHTGPGTYPRYGRGFGPAGSQFNRSSFPRSGGFNRREHGQTSRMGPNEYSYDNRYEEFNGRQTIGRGGRRGSFRGGFHASSGGAAAAGPSRNTPNRHWHAAPHRGHLDNAFYRRQPFSPEEVFDRPIGGRHYDDPYFYDEVGHGMKRPFYMTHQDHDYMEPSRTRPRLEYTDPASSFRGTRYHDAYGAGRDTHSHEYYGSDYGAYPPPYYRGDSYRGRGGYYY